MNSFAITLRIDSSFGRSIVFPVQTGGAVPIALDVVPDERSLVVRPLSRPSCTARLGPTHVRPSRFDPSACGEFSVAVTSSY